MRTLGVITARGGSKRIPRKNIRSFAGKPLVGWIIEAAMRASLIDRLVVSSDDDEILKYSGTFRPDLPLKRPAELASDSAPSVGSVQHALSAIEGKCEEPFDIAVILQPTNPLTTPDDIDGTIELLMTSSADSAVSIVSVRHLHPLKLKVLDEHLRLYPYFEDDRGQMRYQDLPKVYFRNGAVYASRRYVIDAGHEIGTDCRGYIVPPERSIDIDDELDWEMAEVIAQKRFALM